MKSNSPESVPTTDTVFVGRQPIFTADLKTFAYELLYRSSRQNQAVITDGNQATAQLLLHTFTEIGLERVVGNLPAFVNIPREFLLAGHCLALPKDRVVLEVLEDIKPEPEVLAALTLLRQAGYTIALDDFVHSPELTPLVELADIIKVELPAIPQSEWASHVQQLRKFDVKLLAEKVETHQEFELCKELRFDYYQGYLFCRPTIVEGKQVSAHRVTLMRLVAKLQQPSVGLDDVTEIIQTEPSIALRLLKYVNSANSTLSRPVESIKHAVTMAGIDRIKTLASLSALAEIGSDKPAELIKTVVERARMAELLAIALRKQNVPSYFLTGLFSALDALLDVPMDEALAMVPLTTEVADAIRHQTGELGEVLTCVLQYQQGNWDQVQLAGLEEVDILEAWLEANEWMSV